MLNKSFEQFKNEFELDPVQEYPNQVLAAVPKPLVSCWIVAYNQIDYVKQAVDSVLKQERDFPIEIIIGDDGSNDGTREVLIQYAQEYPDLIRLFLHNRKNNIKIAGGTPNPNFQGIYNWHQCRGEFITTLECDDFWNDSQKLKKQVEFLKTNPDFMGVSSNFHVCDPAGEIIKKNKYDYPVTPEFRLQYINKFHTITKTVACMYRNVPEIKNEITALAQAPFFDQVLFTLFSIRGPLGIMPECMVTFRAGSGFFNPHRHKIGRYQHVVQWEYLFKYLEHTPYKNVGLARLHERRVRYFRSLTWYEKVNYWTGNVMGFSRDPHFRTEWFMIYLKTTPENVPQITLSELKP